MSLIAIDYLSLRKAFCLELIMPPRKMASSFLKGSRLVHLLSRHAAASATTNNGVVLHTRSFHSISERSRNNQPKDICKYILKRCKVTATNWDGHGTMDEVVNYVKSKPAQKIVVMAGAGISTLSGIPDFRSPGTGLYDNLQKYDLPYPEAVFDINFFSHNPKPFYALAQELYPSGTYRPNACHYFVRLLYEKGILLRMLTQNIDGLERLAGIPPKVLVEAHGTFATATCRGCGKKYEGEDIEDSIYKAEVPECQKCQGVIKPDIVFFGEQLPQSFHFACADMLSADLLLVLGTSLEVEPFASTAELVPEEIPRVLFNKVATGAFATDPRPNDVVAKGDMKETLWEFCEELGWDEGLDKLMKKSEAKGRRTNK